MIGFCAVTAFVIAADLITKHLVAAGMELNSTVTVIPGVFDLTYIINRGAAWGILAEKQVLLTAFTVLVLAALVFYVVKKHKDIGKLELVSIAMIVGGGIGNLIGRVFDGYVVDFINIRCISFLNIFNIADIGITVGCVLLVISVLFFGKKQNKTDSGSQEGSAADYSEIRWDQIDGSEDAHEHAVKNDAPEGETGNGR